MPNVNTNTKDAKGRSIMRGPRGGLYVRGPNGQKLKPAVGRAAPAAPARHEFVRPAKPQVVKAETVLDHNLKLAIDFIKKYPSFSRRPSKTQEAALAKKGWRLSVADGSIEWYRDFVAVMYFSSTNNNAMDFSMATIEQRDGRGEEILIRRGMKVDRQLSPRLMKKYGLTEWGGS